MSTDAMPRIFDSYTDKWCLNPSFKHLNHGSFGAVPVVGLEKQAELKAIMESDPVSWFALLPEEIKKARCEIADLLSLPQHQTAIVPNASAGASVIYQNLQLEPGKEILVTNHGYGAVCMGAKKFAKRKQAIYREIDIPINATSDEVESIVLKNLTSNTGLLIIDQITSGTARQFPVRNICRVARDRKILTLVDGAHAIGVLDNPWVSEANFWVANLHKFACSPRGVAVLVSDESQMQELYPLIDSWGTELNYPDRFDYQATSDQTALLAAPTVLKFLNNIGWETIRNHNRQLCDFGQSIVAEQLKKQCNYDPFVDNGDPVGPMRLLRLPKKLHASREVVDTYRIKFRNDTGILAAFTTFNNESFIRISSYLYNTPNDYSYLADKGVSCLMRWTKEITE